MKHCFCDTRVKLLPLLLLLGYLASCATSSTPTTAVGRGESKPKNVDNICEIFSEKTGWLEPAQQSHSKWGIPVELMMAIIRHESSFRSQARPLDKRGKRLSSAYGYAQAIDSTWDLYKKENNKPRADRTKFSDAIDFVGWYSSKSIAKGDNISPFDVNALYVFYHDGWGALPEDGSRKLKPEVLKVAAKIYQQTLLYHRQLKECPKITSVLYGEDDGSVWNSDTQNKNSGNKPSRSNNKQRKSSGKSGKQKGWF